MSEIVSIIVPVFNAEKYLYKCLNSLMFQSYQNLEIILVDDGSTDNSGKICDEFVNIDSRFIVIHKSNEGVTNARIDGYNKSEGRYVFFIDADDYLEDNAIELLVKNEKETNADVIVSDYAKVFCDKKLSKRISFAPRLYNRNEIVDILKTSCLYDKRIKRSGFPLFLWGKLYKREVLLDVLKTGSGFWYNEDALTTVQLLYLINSLSIIESVLYNYVVHEGQVTKKNPKVVFNACAKSWKKLLQIDTKGYLKDQRPARHFRFITELLDRLIQEGNYSDYKDLFIVIHESDIIQEEIILNKCFIPYDVKDKIHFFLFKRKFIFLFFILNKMYSKITRIA